MVWVRGWLTENPNYPESCFLQSQVSISSRYDVRFSTISFLHFCCIVGRRRFCDLRHVGQRDMMPLIGAGSLIPLRLRRWLGRTPGTVIVARALYSAQALRSGPTLRPYAQALRSGPTLRPYAQARQRLNFLVSLTPGHEYCMKYLISVLKEQSLHCLVLYLLTRWPARHIGAARALYSAQALYSQVLRLGQAADELLS